MVGTLGGGYRIASLDISTNRYETPAQVLSLIPEYEDLQDLKNPTAENSERISGE